MSDKRSIKLASLLLAVCSLFAVPTTGQADEQTHAFFVGKLWPGHEQPIDDAVMIVVDGRIQSVGKRTTIDVPKNAVRHDLADAVVVPGFVIAETSIGIASDDQRAITPEVRAVDGFDMFADYSQYVAAGITTVQISPGRQRLMPGQGAVVKLAGDDYKRRVLSRQESLRIILSRDSASAPRIYEPPVGAVSVDNPLEPTRPQIAESLAARIAGLRAVFAAARAGEVDPDEVVDFDSLREMMKLGRIRIKASTAPEIRAALNLVDELQKYTDRKLQLVLSDVAELDSFLTDVQRMKSIGIVFNAQVRPGQVSNTALPAKDAEPKTFPWDHTAELFANGAGDSVAIRPSSDTDLDDMLFLAGLFTRGGTSQYDVLKTLTVNPARMLGVDSRVGHLSAGRDADFVVLSGDPFNSGSLIEATWVNGERVFHRTSETKATLVQAATVYTSAGHTTSGGVLVSGAKIQAIGDNVSVPNDVAVRRFPGAVIVPGFVDLGTGLGFGGSVSGVKITTKLGDRLAADDPTIAYARQGGVTTAVYATTVSPSPLLAFKLGNTPRLLKEPVGIRFTMPSNLTSGIPSLKRTLGSAKAYAASWTKYETDLAAYKIKRKEYEAAVAKYEAKKKLEAAKKAAEAKAAAAKAASSKTAEKKPESKTDKEDSADKKKSEDDKSEKPADSKTEAAKADADSRTDATKSTTEKTATAKPKVDPDAPVKPTEPKKPKSSSTLEPYRSLMAAEIPAVVEAKSVNAIRAAVKLFREEYKLPMILVGADNAYREVELLARNDVHVSVGPVLVRRVENRLINLPQVLANNGVPFAFQSNATTGVQQLPLAVQYSVFRGLGPADALNGLTGSAAKLLSLDSIGSLEAGKDADLVVLSGPPFEPSSQILAVMIDGEWVYERGATR